MEEQAEAVQDPEAPTRGGCQHKQASAEYAHLEAQRDWVCLRSKKERAGEETRRGTLQVHRYPSHVHVGT